MRPAAGGLNRILRWNPPHGKPTCPERSDMNAKSFVALLVCVALVFGYTRYKIKATAHPAPQAGASVKAPSPPESVAPKPVVAAPAPVATDWLHPLIGQEVTLSGVAESKKDGAAVRGEDLYVRIAGQSHWQGHTWEDVL